jgi:iron(III) transport system substrate-binding protein
MRKPRRAAPTRRVVLRNLLGGAIAGALSRGTPAAADDSAVTPELVAAARKEGAVTFVTAADVALAQKIANAFEAKYPGIKVAAERNGSERIFQRLDQEYASGIAHVDVVDSADAAHFIVWKRNGWLAPYVPDEVARLWPEHERDPDGMFQTFRASLSIMGMNTRLVKPEDAPKSYADLLDPKWRGKLVKGHPGYSGTIVTTTFLLAQHFGWTYLEQLAKQRVMQVQSATEPPKKIAIGERAVMVEGSDYVLFDQRDKGSPVEPIFPTEGTPLIPIPTAVLAKAPHPNAARLFQSFLYTLEAQQMIVDVGNSRAFHPHAKEKPGRKTMAELTLWRADPAQLLDAYEEVRRKYSEIFGT